jgi:uracil-DNA glycosylase
VRPVLIVGEAPTAATEGYTALTEAGRSGRRLARLAGVEHLADRFGVINLVDHWPGRTAHGDAFPAGLARDNARLLLGSLPADVALVLLGRRVERAFGLERGAYFRWRTVQDRQSDLRAVVTTPHPSGANRWWNEPANVRRARRFWRGLAEEAGGGDGRG